MRHVRDAGLGPDLRVGDAVTDRREKVVHGSVERPEERRRDALRTRAHGDRVRLDRQTLRVGLRRPAVDVEERDALAVDRHLELLVEGGVGPEQLSGRDRVQEDREDVLAVRGEVVNGGDATARSDRRTLHLIPLRREARLLVGDGRDARLRVADGQPAEFTRGVEVRVEQRGRWRLRVGDVVEVRALGVEREPLAGVDVEAEEVVNGPLVLGAVETLERAGPGLGLERGRAVDEAFEGFGERGERIAAGSPASGRRHHAGTELRDHLLGHVGGGRGVGDVERLENEVPGFAALVVAGAASLPDDSR